VCTRAMAPNTRGSSAPSPRIDCDLVAIERRSTGRSTKSSWSPNWRRSSEGLSDELEHSSWFSGAKDAPLLEGLCQLAQEIRGLPRHVSQHPGGMIISSRPLIEIVPLERAAMEDRRRSASGTRTPATKRALHQNRFPRAGHVVARRGMRRADRPPPRGRAATRPLAHRLEIPRSTTASAPVTRSGSSRSRAARRFQMIRRSRSSQSRRPRRRSRDRRPGPRSSAGGEPVCARGAARKEAAAARTAAGKPYEPPSTIPCSAKVSRKRWASFSIRIRCCKSARRSPDSRRTGRSTAARDEPPPFARSDGRVLGGVQRRRPSRAASPKHRREGVRSGDCLQRSSDSPQVACRAFGLLAYQSAWLRHYHPSSTTSRSSNNQPMGFTAIDRPGP